MSLTTIFQDIANAIRSKTGKADSIYPSDMASEIESIEGGGKAQNLKTIEGTTVQQGFFSVEMEVE
jgi:hypothetical protein